MAKMHTRRKGQSRSTRPLRFNPPEWSDLSTEEIEKVAVELAGQGKSTAEIGTVLRDTYGVSDVKLATGKKITQILREHGVAPKLPEDLTNLIVKALSLRRHLEANPKDLHNKRSLHNMESKIRRLVKYYKNEGVLPEDWAYKPETAEMMISR